MRFDLYVYNSPLGQWSPTPVASVNSTVGEVLLGRAVHGAAKAFGERWVAVYDKAKQSWAVWDSFMQVAGGEELGLAELAKRKRLASGWSVGSRIRPVRRPFRTV